MTYESLQKVADEMKSEALLKTVLNFLSSEEVHIKKTKDDMGILLSVRLDKADMGKVIGKGGETIKSIRTIVRAIGMAEGARVNIKVEEPKTILQE